MVRVVTLPKSNSETEILVGMRPTQVTEVTRSCSSTGTEEDPVQPQMESTREDPTLPYMETAWRDPLRHNSGLAQRIAWISECKENQISRQTTKKENGR